jgi:uncharacterized delta-60 repeat protein
MDFALVRYNNDGSLDDSFGNGGVVTTTIGKSAQGRGVAIQPDGKIIVGGLTIDSQDSFSLARYTITGSLDSEFGNGGVVTTVIGAHAAGRDVDGQILVAGDSVISAKLFFTLARYTITGSPDSSFGNSGIVTTAISNLATINAIAVQPDGKIVAVGGSGTNSQNTLSLARYTITGSLDSEFGSGGVVTTPIDNNYFSGQDLIIQPDNKIIVTGYNEDSSANSYIALARYNNNGNLDSEFGNGGIVTTSIGIDAYSARVAIQTDGKIVVAGGSIDGLQHTFALARYTDNGSLDSEFGNNGVVTTTIDDAADGIGITIQPQGQIIVIGRSLQGIQTNFALARYLGGEPISNPNLPLYLPVVIKQ